MRPPVARVFKSPNAARRRRAVFGNSGGCILQHLSLALGIDAAPTEGLSVSLSVVVKEHLPPFLALAFLSQCWVSWTVSICCASEMQNSRIGADDAEALGALLKASEESLRSYVQQECSRERNPRVHAPRRQAGSTAGSVSTHQLGYHHIVEHMLQTCGGHLTLRTLILLLRYAVTVEESEGAVLEELVGLLSSLTGSDHVIYKKSLQAVLAASLPVHVAPVVLSVLRRHNINADIVKLCLHHVAVVVRGRHTGALSVETVMGGFHECAVKAFSWLLRNMIRDQYQVGICIQVMSCLKHAPVFLLCDVYRVMEDHQLVTPSVQCKFLANCGIAISTSNTVSHECAEVIVRAFRSLSRSGRDTNDIEEGLVHGSAALLVLRREDLVRDVYAACPMLRETPHSVMAYVRNGDVVRANQALLRLAQSRDEGWINVPLPVMQAIHEVCVMVGCSGGPNDMAPLYRALVSFHNPGMIVSQCIEYVLAGICDRLCGVGKQFPKSAPPRAVLDHVLPLFRAVLSCIGDDINVDMILQILETAVTVKHFGVPLASSIVWALQHSSSLALKELFSRVDPSTNGTPFLSYYVLCFTRDRGQRDTVEHLATVWHCESDPILKRHPSLAPLYKLWKCAACGRLNSDRFNYCLCSALRNSFVICARCGYAQDERWSSCQSCGERMNDNSIAAAVVRRSWTCDDCGASNPARQVTCCFRCKSPCGPGAKALTQLEGLKSEVCQCSYTEKPNEDKGKTRMAHYCRECGWFRETWAAKNSVVWCCEGCGELRSSLDRTCPNCPQVDCLPFAVVLTSSDSLLCSDCRLPAANPFAVKCPQCDGILSAGALGQEMKLAGTTIDSTSVALRCSDCGFIASGNVSQNCAECGKAMQDAKLLQISARQCEGCNKEVGPLHIGAVCIHCAMFLPPVAKEGWSAAVVHETFRVLLQLSDRSVEFDGMVKLLEKLIHCFHTQVELTVVEETRVVVAMASSRLQINLRRFMAHDATARRAIALTKHLLEYIDTKCCIVGVSHFSAGQCRHCLGSHQEELCAYQHDSWLCEECGADNNNADVCRYVCRNCLALRPCVREACPTEAWECLQCQRVNVAFEAYCIFCGAQRAAVESAVEEAAEASPFLPAKCASCGLVYLEARCPLCHNNVPESMNKVSGVVCLVTSRYAFIQPEGTEHPSQRVYVGEPWLRKRRWAKGDNVIFTAQLNKQGGFRVTAVHQ
ncbi:hypothetical protein DQ04_00211280 [Trypanosoma grayi]|uniref:hypothetical protein n=1 Tax=Trypanosoma grayi TaxID=71804 RepID=UPI0004F46397|nr:hypothetical protein DQ04_00211280 [Trypanosoma grayi]KEG15045.1 hypothetical protein DQ04_00211280 [Trypanosoma grayi]